MQDAASRMDVRPLRVSEQLGGASDLAGRRLDGLGSPVRLRRSKVDPVGVEDAVHDRFRNVEVNDARASAPADARRAPEELGEPIERRHRAAPLGHRTGDAGLVEVLVGAPAIRVRDRRAPARRDQQDAVALAVLHGDAGQDVRDAGPVRSHANAELAGQPRVRARHVRGAGFVSRRHHPDAVLLEACKEAHVRAVDDAEHDLDALPLPTCERAPHLQPSASWRSFLSIYTARFPGKPKAKLLRRD